METACFGPCDGRLLFLLSISSLFTLYAFISSLWTGTHSYVDKYWSFLPSVYAWICYFFQPSDRGLLACILTSIWACRLTYNFMRKGGYSGVEDYRWGYVRKWFPNQLSLCCFNFWFISLFQNVTILAFSSPAYVISLYPGLSLTWKDYVVAAVMLTFIGLEAVADHQQWVFQSTKAKFAGEKLPMPEAYKLGFVTTGLFRYSRHPNFFSELSIWWTFHLFSLLASQQYLHWTLSGPLALLAIFHGSTTLTEKISAGKYPKYAEYQKTTSRIFPGWPSSPSKLV